jgi:protein TonB
MNPRPEGRRYKSESAHSQQMASHAAQLDSESLKRPLLFSAAFHALLLCAILASALLNRQGENWGDAGGGGAITVGLVGSVPGVTLPKPDVVTENRVVDETKGLYKSEPAKPVPPPANATEIPKFAKNQPKPYVSQKSRLLENQAVPPPNAIPYGQGGAPAIPYSSFTMGQGTQGGMGVAQGNGNFGSRFPWYVEAVQRKISGNWLQASVDPNLRWAPRVVASFQVMRDGSIANIQVTRSSGNSSVDTSAVRAIHDSSPMQPLPNGYSGSYVNVEFWFDYRR